METLLGHISQFASFSTQGEVLCTQGLAYLLQEYREAQAEFATEIAAVTGVKIGDSLTWRAEVRQERDGGRPDLEACTTATNPLRNGSDDRERPDLEAYTTDNVPTVKIEAKLGAALDPGQLKSYTSDLQSRSPGSAFLVLVPRRRIKEATKMVAEVFELAGPSPWPNVAIAVVSWEAVLDAFGRVECGRFRGELEQFEAMYRVLSGGYIQPLAGPEELTEWRKRETDFVNLVNQVTRRLTTHHNVLPMGVEPLEQAPEELESKGYRRRYVCQTPGEPESCFSIGVRDPFKKKVSPIWLRFHKNTGRFCDIRDRLEASYLAPRLVRSGGHVWIPLDLPMGVDGSQMVDTLVVQAKEIVRVGYEPKP